jgi:DNA-binding NarL/FixJ family response regulator
VSRTDATPGGQPIRVLLVDDHQLVRAGLASLLDQAPDVRVVGQAGDGAEAVALAREVRPDVVLMDLSMPVLDGVEATRRIVDELPTAQVLVLTSFSDRNRVDQALGAGAIGYLLKDSEPDDLLDAVRAAARGESPLDPRVARALLPRRAAEDPVGTLSARERQVLALVTRGLANKQIGRALGITERTVKVHLGNAFRRIGVRDRTSAALWTREHLPEATDPPAPR